MKKKTLTVLSFFTLALAACGEAPAADSFQVKQVNIYRNRGVVDKTIGLRFYEKTPNVPYISVKDFYKEFFNTDVALSREGNVYCYSKLNNGFLRFNAQDDTITLHHPDVFASHPDFKTSNAKHFLSGAQTHSTPARLTTVSLSDYKMDVYGSDEAYVPLSLLSSLSGGLSGYNIAYNSKDIFVLDLHGNLNEGERNYAYFGDVYTAPMVETGPRPKDLAEHSYHQLCFNVDHLRGYTTQMIFGDNNILTLGLDGTLELYNPELKKLLLSTDKNEYYAGFASVMSGLFDGGHTMGEILGESFVTDARGKVTLDPGTESLNTRFMVEVTQSLMNRSAYGIAKKKAFQEDYDGKTKTNYYRYDPATKLAYIGFDSFLVNYDQWNDYYTQGKKASDVPTSGDSFAFVRSSLYRALSDQAQYVVLDLSTNGGGDSVALCGILALFNNAGANFETNNVLDQNRTSEHFACDINLDGVFNSADEEEAKKFASSFKTAVLTSPNSFSCGNLLPSLMKEANYPIIGQRSGGGSCAVAYESTADGLTYYRSSHLCLSNQEGENIDGGVPLNHEIEITKAKMDNEAASLELPNPKEFYDFTTIAEYMATLNETHP